MPNGTYGGVRGGSNFPLLDYVHKRFCAKKWRILTLLLMPGLVYLQTRMEKCVKMHEKMQKYLAAVRYL